VKSIALQGQVQGIQRHRPWPLQITKTILADTLSAIDHRLDVNTLEKIPAEKLARPLFADPNLESRGTGTFIIIDESSNNTVGVGMIL